MVAMAGERFVDPTSGRLTEVHHDPETGERDYVEVDGYYDQGASC